MITFAHPAFLWLFLLLPPVIWAGYSSRVSLGKTQRMAAVTIRVLLIAVTATALALPRWLRPSDELSVVCLIDRSASVPPEADAAVSTFLAKAGEFRRSKDSILYAGFGGNSMLLENGPQTVPAPASVQPEATDIERALDFAVTLFPAGQERRILLLSDGLANSGDARAAGRRLAAAGIPVWAVPLPASNNPELAVGFLEAPKRPREGEPFAVRAGIRSNRPATATLRIYLNQFLVSEKVLTLPEGETVFTQENLQPRGSIAKIEAELIPEPGSDTIAANNRRSLTIPMRGRSRVLVLDSDEPKTRPVAEALRREGFDVETRGPAGVPRQPEALQAFDLLILGDFPALQLGRETMEVYRRWVRDFGGGFILVGGENSYGAGGYQKTAIEEMLPVHIEHKDRQDLPSVALLVILDRSGSMTATVAGQTKMALANQGAALALAVLQPKDFFGVLAVDTRPHVVAPLIRHTSRDAIAQRILSVNAGGGGIYIYTSLAEAFQQLRDIQAKVKHVILFSDAADAEEKNAGEMGDGTTGEGSSLDLASAMLSAKITTSVVALGAETDRDTAFLRELAERGNGRFYLTNDATTLPQIFGAETIKVTQSSLVEEPTVSSRKRPHPILDGIDWPNAPLLLGYNATRIKPTADLLLASERDEPLLAVWRYGLGNVAAFTSDYKPRWASEWMEWNGFGKFWAQLARHTGRVQSADAWESSIVEQGEELLLRINAFTAANTFRNRLQLGVNTAYPDGQTQTTVARQVAPGSYEAVVKPARAGATLIGISARELPNATQTLAVDRGYPPEYARFGTDSAALQELATITGGRFGPAPADLFGMRSDHRVMAAYELWPPLMILALLLLPLDIWNRRREPRAVSSRD